MTRRPICLGCKNLRKPADDFKCEAFPRGIPIEILRNEKDHRKVVEGDKGIVFEARTPEDDDYAKDVFRSTSQSRRPQGS